MNVKNTITHKELVEFIGHEDRINTHTPDLIPFHYRHANVSFKNKSF